MKRGAIWAADFSRVAFAVLLLATRAGANTNTELHRQVAELEATGDISGARSLLEGQQQQSGAGGAEELAKFLDHHRDPARREAYLKWAAVETDPEQRKLALRQVVLLDFIDGKSSEVEGDLARYREAGGRDFPAAIKREKPVIYSKVMLPGPLSSFARMAALSPDLAPDELLAALARNVVTNGYEAAGNDLLQQTEYLRLLNRYLGEARELQALAGAQGKIVIPNCDSEQTGALLKVLGYRMRGSCGSDIVLETVNPTRAFLTVDSGFPLTQLEQDLRANHRFELPYAPTPIPVLYNAEYWLSALGRNSQSEFIETFLSDPGLCRLYLGISHLDRATAEALRKQSPAARLKAYAHVLDFFGSMFQIRNGAAVVPGSPKVWTSLVGVSPNNPGAFFERLIQTDDGWMASYFDALSRIEGPTATYLTEPERMRRFYEALKGRITTPGPARPVFRSSTELMLLTTALRLDPNGQAHVPGNLAVWQNLFIHHPHGKYDGRLTRAANSWKASDDLVEALFALSRKTVENEPLKIFLLLNDLDRARTRPMSPELAGRLISTYRSLGTQYEIFADAPLLSEAAIQQYLDTCVSIGTIHDTLLRSDTLGSTQALVGLWRVLTLSGAIPPDREDASFRAVVAPFVHAKSAPEVFDGSRAGLDALLAAAGGERSGSRQERLVELLVGKVRVANSAGLPSPAEKFLRIYDAQLLVPVDSIFALADHTGKPDPKSIKLLNEQLDRLEEVRSQRSSLSADEKSTLAVGYWTERHIEQERKFNADSLVKNPEKRDARALLLPFLRDSLTGYLYSYYAPAGAQLLLANPMFVRSHDFIGPENAAAGWKKTEVGGSGWPESSGGRLVGSLVGLPYALAEAEQNFMSPRREQALIWADLVPQMIVSVTIPRWRNIQSEQLRWVALHVERGRTLLAAAALDPAIESAVVESYRRFASPVRVESLQDELHAGNFAAGESSVPTSVLYAIASDPALKTISPDIASQDIDELAARAPNAVTPEAISHAFGTPKPTLTHSYRPALLNLRTFPALMGFSSRILAESWESNSIYYAELADEAGVPPNELDSYVPEWNRAAIENIFATHLEDWPALLRSLQILGASVRERTGNGGAAQSGLN